MKGKRSAPVFRATSIIASVFLTPFFRLETEGLENLPVKNAFVLLPKHQRWQDIPLLALATPRPLYYMAKHELFANPLSGWFLTSLGGIPLNRSRPLESRRYLRTMTALLRGGEGIVIFPEGTYFKNRMGPGHRGLVRMVLNRFNLPFIPVGIRYGERGFRRKVHVHFGQPVYGDPSGGAREFLDRMMREISRLSGIG